MKRGDKPRVASEQSNRPINRRNSLPGVVQIVNPINSKQLTHCSGELSKVLDNDAVTEKFADSSQGLCNFHTPHHVNTPSEEGDYPGVPTRNASAMLI